MEDGEFKIIAAKSSAEEVLETTVKVISTTKKKRHYDRASTLAELQKDPSASAVVNELLQPLSAAFGTPLDEDSGMMEMFRASPLRQFVLLSGGAFTPEMLEAILGQLNG